MLWFQILLSKIVATLKNTRIVSDSREIEQSSSV